MDGASIITNTTSKFDESTKKINGALTSILDTTIDTATMSDTSSENNSNEKKHTGHIDFDDNDSDDDVDGGAFIREILAREDTLEEEV